MRFIPGLTSTRKEAIGPFLAELRSGSTREIALFPTCLDADERRALYRELEAIRGLRVPHVHLRADMGCDEISWLASRLGAEVFNIHAALSAHPYRADPGAWRSRIFVENADAVPSPTELESWGGLCVDFAHWESGTLLGDPAYAGFGEVVRAHRVGCCHVSAVRPGIRSRWGGFDHHEFATLEDLSYLARYAAFLPVTWASVELENGLAEQLGAIAWLEASLARAGA